MNGDFYGTNESPSSIPSPNLSPRERRTRPALQGCSDKTNPIFALNNALAATYEMLSPQKNTLPNPVVMK